MAEPDPMVQLETAIVARLGAANQPVSDDPALAALAPGGVHSRTAPSPPQFPYIVIRLTRQDDDNTFGRVYRHRFKYSIQATDQSAAIDAASAALERVRQLLHDCDEDPTMPQMEDFTLGYSRRAGRTSLSPRSGGDQFQQITDEWAMEVYPK